MHLSGNEIEAIKTAAIKVGDFGKITLCIQDGILLDIVTEERIRIQNPIVTKKNTNKLPVNK